MLFIQNYVERLKSLELASMHVCTDHWSHLLLIYFTIIQNTAWHLRELYKMDWCCKNVHTWGKLIGNADQSGTVGDGIFIFWNAQYPYSEKFIQMLLPSPAQGLHFLKISCASFSFLFIFYVHHWCLLGTGISLNSVSMQALALKFISWIHLLPASPWQTLDGEGGWRLGHLWELPPAPRPHPGVRVPTPSQPRQLEEQLWRVPCDQVQVQIIMSIIISAGLYLQGMSSLTFSAGWWLSQQEPAMEFVLCMLWLQLHVCLLQWESRCFWSRGLLWCDDKYWIYFADSYPL